MPPIILFAAIMAATLAEPWQHVTGPDGVWFMSRLPADMPAGARLVMRGYTGELQLFVEERAIYDFHNARAAGRLTIHVIDLPADAAGKRLRARVPRDARPPYFSDTRVAAPSEVPDAIAETVAAPVREDVDDLIIGSLIAAVGLFCMVIAGFRRRGDTRPLLYFGLFALLYGTRLIVQSSLLPLLGARLETMGRIEWLITYVITIPGWALARLLIGDGWRSSLRWQVWAFAIFAPIGIASDFIQGEAGTMETANNVLVVTGGVNILLNLIAARRRGTRELRVMLAGSMVFMLFALANNLASLDLLPVDEIDETPGFVIFLGTLGYAAARQFARAEREQAELQGELAAAREIQRSILPSSMPNVTGLRFDARYVPATSVAGDLYDVTALDERRAAVLVADVSGHGIPAALIASMVKVGVSSQSRLADSPAELLRELNAILTRDVRRGFVTATYLYFDGVSVHVANAGHPPPLLLRDREVQELGTPSPLLGRFRDATYSASATELRAGDRILAFSDGLIEAHNRPGEAFGEERLHTLLTSGASLSSIVEAVQGRRGGGSEVDDLTVVSIEVI